MKTAQELPGFRRRECDPIQMQPPQMINMSGKPTMIVHCLSMGTGICANKGQDGRNFEGQIMITCYTAGQIGLMYLMSVEDARNTAASLNRLCDAQEAAAKDAAAAALQKAAGK